MLGFNMSTSPPQGEVRWPEVTIAPQRLSDTLVIFHDGHMVVSGCHYDDDGTMDWLNELGYDAMHIQMPLHGCNLGPGEDPLSPWSHDFFAQFAGPDGSHSDEFPFLRFFLEPVWLTINYAQTLGYKNIVMAGLSGGGWTTTMMAAIDPRIGLSFPVAGSMPCDFAHTFVLSLHNVFATSADAVRMPTYHLFVFHVGVGTTSNSVTNRGLRLPTTRVCTC